MTKNADMKRELADLRRALADLRASRAFVSVDGREIAAATPARPAPVAR